MFLCSMFKPATVFCPIIVMGQYNKVVQTRSLMVKVLAACLGQMLAFSTHCFSFSSANSKKTPPKKKQRKGWKGRCRETAVISLELFQAAISKPWCRASVADFCNLHRYLVEQCEVIYYTSE